MAKKTDPRRTVVTAAFALAGEKGWRNVSLVEVSEKAGLGLAEVYALFPDKGAIAADLMRQVDEAVLAAGPADMAEPPRDRLFEVLMRRFDALAPYKAGVVSVVGDCQGDPMAWARAAFGLHRAMDWMLEAAGIPSDGFRGRLKAKGLAAIYLGAFRVWLRDDTEDMARTMAALDKGLRRAEGFASWLGRGRDAAGEEAAATS